MVQQIALPTAVLLAVLATAPQVHADSTDNFAYVRATSQLDREISPAKFHPLNLVDHNPATLWCEGKKGLGDNESVSFFFKSPQTIDRVILTPSSGGRAIASLRFTDGTRSVRMNLGADANQRIEEVLTTPLRGDTYQLIIEKVGDPQKDAVFASDVSCIADVALYHGELLLNPVKAKYDELLDGLVGAWAHEPLGASESTIIFSLDGTWDWSHQPLAGGKREAASGTYRLRNGRLLMRKGTTGHFTVVDVRSHHVTVDPDDMGAPAGDYDTLYLGDGFGKEFGGTYNNARFN